MKLAAFAIYVMMGIGVVLGGKACRPEVFADTSDGALFLIGAVWPVFLGARIIDDADCEAKP